MQTSQQPSPMSPPRSQRSPMSPPRSQRSPMSPPHSSHHSSRSRRTSRREIPERTESLPSLPPNSPSPPFMPPPERFHFREAQRRCGSFEAPHPQRFEGLRTPPHMGWQFNPHRLGPGNHAPLSPRSGHMSPNRQEFMFRHPMSPGGHPMSPGGHPMSPCRHPMSAGGHPRVSSEYVHMPPRMSPVMNRSWSPHSFTFGQHPPSPRSYPGPGWGSPMSVPRGYPRGDLAVPVLSRESSMPLPHIQTSSSSMCMSPMQMGSPVSDSRHHSCRMSPAAFTPPRISTAPSPRISTALADKTLSANRDSPTTMSTKPFDKSKLSPQQSIVWSSQSSSDSPAVVVCSVLDESRSDNVLKPEIEAILSDERFDPDMTLDYLTEDLDFKPSNEVSCDSDSPLPFDHYDNQESLMEFSEDILQMPIAPCDGDFRLQQY
jgi:hypothetical protein